MAIDINKSWTPGSLSTVLRHAHLFLHRQENVERVKNMEAALQAADRALQSLGEWLERAIRHAF